MLDQLDMADAIHAYPRDLSVGERQRAALGAVIAARPNLLLLDEPTRGLDTGAKHKLGQVLQHFAATGAGVLVATHDQALIGLCADRTLRLDAGTCT